MKKEILKFMLTSIILLFSCVVFSQKNNTNIKMGSETIKKNEVIKYLSKVLSKQEIQKLNILWIGNP